MAGNVAEWVNDFYSCRLRKRRNAESHADPQTSSSLNRVVRGGSLGDAEINIRVSKRSSVLGSAPGVPLDASTIARRFFSPHRLSLRKQ